MPREILVHLNATVPDGDDREADEVANAILSAYEVGSDDESVRDLAVVYTLAEEIAVCRGFAMRFLEGRLGPVSFYRWDPGWSLGIWRWQIDRHYMTDGRRWTTWHRRPAGERSPR